VDLRRCVVVVSDLGSVVAFVLRRGVAKICYLISNICRYLLVDLRVNILLEEVVNFVVVVKFVNGGEPSKIVLF
jgi:hypothetical protein